MAVVDLAQETGTITRKERSLWAEAFRRLLKNKVAVGSSILIFALVMIAFFRELIGVFFDVNISDHFPGRCVYFIIILKNVLVPG